MTCGYFISDENNSTFIGGEKQIRIGGDNMNPKISIILPNYNSKRYLKETLESVLNQTYQNFELIVIDDASTDNSMEIVKSFGDERITCIRSDINRQVAYTANLGMKLAKGEYIARIDSDDIWNPKKLEIQLSYMEEHPETGACFTRVNVVDENSEIANKKYQTIYDLFEKAKNMSQKEWLELFLAEGNCLCHSSALMRRSVFKNIGGFYNVAYVGAEDYELWVRMIIRYPIHLLDERLVMYRWEEHSTTKISALTTEKVYAAINLQMMVKSQLLDYMTDEEFVRYFNDKFEKKEAGTTEELECEKAAFLLKCSGKEVNFLGLQRYAKLLNRPEILKLLENQNDFSLTGFYDLLKVRNFGIPGELEEKEKQILELKTKQKKNKELIVQLQEQMSELKNKMQMSEDENKSLKETLEKMKKSYKDMVCNYETSKSWRLTKPLRKVGMLVRHKQR